MMESGAQSVPPDFTLPGYHRKALLLKGRANLARGRPALAAAQLALVLQGPEGLSAPEEALAAFTRAEAELTAGDAGAAERTLLEYIRALRDPRFLSAAFERLKELLAGTDRDAEAALRPLIASDDPARRAPALFWLARRLAESGADHEQAQALELWETLVTDYPEHRLAGLSAVELLQLYRQQLTPEQVLQSYRELPDPEGFEPVIRARLNFLLAMTHFEMGQYKQASRHFQKAAGTDSQLATQAIYDQALAWLQEEEGRRFFQQFLEKPELADETRLKRALQLEYAKELAQHQDYAAARDVLSQLRQQEEPGSSEALRARLLEAHLAFEQGNRAGAREILAQMREPAEELDDAEILAEMESLSFWIAARDPGTPRDVLMRRAEDFLNSWGQTPPAVSIRFKLGELYYQAGQYPRAQREFETIAEELERRKTAPRNQNGKAGEALELEQEAALFHAARAAQRSMNERGQERAVELLERVAAMDGDFAGLARLEKAHALAALNRPGEALPLFQELAGSKQAPLRHQALQALAQAHFDLSAEEPEHLERVLEITGQLLAEPDLPLEPRNFTLYLQGRALRELGRTEDALLSFYQALEDPAEPNAPPEFLWQFRAGFAAVDILEQRENPRSALSILQRLADAGGPRSEEARERMSLLRLRHFLWDEEEEEERRGLGAEAGADHPTSR
jgi:hypothetical protein